MNHRSFAVRTVAVLTCAAMLCTGCTQTRVTTLAAYAPGAPAKLDVAPDVAVYKIKYTSADHEELRTLRGSKRLVGAGRPIGFERGPAGEVIAVAGEERFTALVPAGARYCVWYTKSKEPTEFALAANDAGNVLGATAVLAGVVAGALVVTALNDNDCHHHGHHPQRGKCRKCR